MAGDMIEANPHIIDGEFQSDKYPTCPRGKVPLSTKDPTAQDLLWEYAQRRRSVDAEFAADLEWALRKHGYVPRDGEGQRVEGGGLYGLMDRARALWQAKFPQAGLTDHLRKLSGEVQELIDAPSDDDEWADVLLCFLMAAGARGLSADDLIRLANAKAAICEAQEFVPMGDGTFKRVKTEAGTGEELCSDCPPRWYPTDKTRCAPCPRRELDEADKEVGHILAMLDSDMEAECLAAGTTMAAEAAKERALFEKVAARCRLPRFFIDHDMIHDRETGQHVTTAPDDEPRNGMTITGCCEFLNGLAAELTRLKAEQSEAARSLPVVVTEPWVSADERMPPFPGYVLIARWYVSENVPNGVWIYYTGYESEMRKPPHETCWFADDDELVPLADTWWKPIGIPPSLSTTLNTTTHTAERRE